MMHSDRRSLRQALQRTFRGRQRKRQGTLRHFETMESRFLLAADVHFGLQDPPLLELHGEYTTIEPVSLLAEGEGAIVAEGEAAQDLVAFAQALAASGTRFYGAAWCPHCTAQKELFEDGADFLPFIEVTNLDDPVTLNDVGDGTDTTLNPSGVPIDTFPTWEFPDGTRLEGEQTLATLSQRSNVAIPSSDQPFIAPIDDGNQTSTAVDADGDAIVTLLGGSPLHIALDGYDPGGGSLTYTVSSSDPGFVSATLLQGNRSMVIDVAGWGKMNLQLFEQRAPHPTSRLIQLAEADFYDNVTFHRIVNGFVIQGGDPTGTGSGGSQLGDFDDQFHTELQHNRTGVLSYAKSYDDTNDSQFFITEVATRNLDGNHSVSGILVEGDKNREAISENSTTNPRDVVMNSVDIITDTENAVLMLDAIPGTTGTAMITVTATDADGNQFSRSFTVNVQPDTSDTLPWLGEVNEIKVPAGQSTPFQFPIIDVEGDPSQLGVVAPTNFTVTMPTETVTSMADIMITPNAGFVGQETITFYVADAELDLTGVTITEGILQNNSTLFDVQSLIVEAEGSTTGATVTGIVFSDNDRDGVLDTGESGLGGFIVFSDSNGNGSSDAGEATATTAADGTYSLSLPAGQHTIRQLAVTNVLQTTTNPITLDLQTGETVEDVRFGTFNVTAPASVDLLAVTDSGNDTDNVTNFNNSAVDRVLQFRVSGVVDGATVRLFADGVLIGQGTANSGATITTNAAMTLTDGVHSIVATQEVEGMLGPDSASLTITIDSAPPGDFTSVAPTAGIVNNDLSYNANSSDEGNGVTYSLADAPTGATINPSSGVLSWTPTTSQLGENNFDIVATDVAGNTTRQQLAVRVTNDPIVGASFKITANADPDSAEIDEVTVGETFFLHVSVTDLRDDARGTFAFYEDIVFDGLLAAGQNITYSSRFPNVRAGSILDGEIDEVGAVNFDTNGVGPGTFHIFSVEFTATRSGTLNLVGNPPDVLPAHDVLVLGVSNALPSSDIVFGATELDINPRFGANDDIFNFDEDSTNITLDVLANDSSLSGSTANLTITSISPQVAGVSIAADGKSLRYSPAANFNGEISFGYTVSDGGDDLSANVVVQIHPINDAPVAANDTAIITAGTTNNFINVLANDTDVDGDQLRVQSVGQLSGSGTIAVASSGTGLNYTPGQGFVGADTVTYTITDGHGGTSQATLTLTINGAGSDSFTVDEGSLDTPFDVLQNDIGSGLTITAVGATSNGGIVTIVNNGSRLNYSRPANDNYFGPDTFTYTARASNGQVSTASVVVTVVNTNDPPTAVNDTFHVAKGTSGNPLNVLANDSNAPDPSGETLTVVSVDGANTIGTVSLVNGTVQYSAPATFPSTGLATGTDTFTYTIDDGTGLTSQATATVEVVDFIPGSLSGFVYVDGGNDGVRDSGDEGFEGVTITLSGTDDFGTSISRQTQTASDGAYSFAGLPPGAYTITETQPTGSRNGVPIVDGKDTVGSQGGTVSANDQFSITLTEGTDGINNNFGELLGRTLAGSIALVANGSGGAEMFGGLNLLLFASDSDLSIGNEIATVNTVGGTFEYAGIAPGNYRLLAETPAFLLPNAANVLDLSVTAEMDSTGNLVNIRGREAAFISLRDISTAAPTEYAHVAVGSSGQQWYSLGPGWEVFTDASFTTTDGGARLRIEVTDATGQVLGTEIATSDARIRVLGQRDGLNLLQIMGGSAAFDLQVIAPANSDGASGEGSTSSVLAAVPPAAATASLATPVAAYVAPHAFVPLPEAEPPANQVGEDPFQQPVIGRSAPALTSVVTTDASLSAPGLQDQLVPPGLLPSNTGQMIKLTPEVASGEVNTAANAISEEVRAALLVDAGDEYGDPFRYGASHGGAFVSLETELQDGEEGDEETEILPADLLDELAADVAIV